MLKWNGLRQKSEVISHSQVLLLKNLFREHFFSKSQVRILWKVSDFKLQEISLTFSFLYQQMPSTVTCVGVSFLIGLRPAALLKRDSNTGVFQQILRILYKRHSCRTPPGDCFCKVSLICKVNLFFNNYRDLVFLIYGFQPISKHFIYILKVYPDCILEKIFTYFGKE